MNRFWTSITRGFLTVAVLLLTATAALLACGPATQSEPGEQQPSLRVAQDNTQSEEPTPTPSPTPTPTPTPAEKYPKLDPTLQKIVGGFEDETWTEMQAAQQASAHHGTTVLVEVETTTQAIDALDTWMGTQSIEPRFPDASYAPPHIYAYIPVSKLGATSQQDGIVMVYAVHDYDAGNREPRGVAGQGGDASPELPQWLKGYPYPRLKGHLQDLVHRYEQGRITAEKAMEEIRFYSDDYADAYKGTSIMVSVTALDYEGETNPIVDWLISNGVSREDLDVFGPDVASFIPISLLGELSWRPGVIAIWGPDIGSVRLPAYDPGAVPDPNNLDPYFSIQPQQSRPTPTPTPVVSQGVGAHGAASWLSRQAR